jgi:phosphoribosylaminoimidazole-succinocarboxamide synthase
MSSFSNDINIRTISYISEYIDKERNNTIKDTNIDINLLSSSSFISKYIGKVRDIYKCNDFILLVTTDRQSAFDRQLASVPYKGQVLNLTSLWWFEQTKHIVPNHIIASPHPNITIGKVCTIFPIEFVMRGYITGSTSTSMWTNYKNGVRNYCGHLLPDNLVKNQKLDTIKLTPTTKDDVHDELISADEIISSGRMSKEDWDICSKYAHDIFEFSQQKSLEKGLILVDTKYEFGKIGDTIYLMDEIHTPDSSRYFYADGFEERQAKKEKQKQLSKEFVREWLIENNFMGKEGQTVPTMSDEWIDTISKRYIELYEKVIGNPFKPEPNSEEATYQLICTALAKHGIQ